MKKFSFLALAAAGLLFAACSSTDDVAENEVPVINGNGDSFVGISIQLPNATTPSLTRGNDDYSDGDAKEYEVKTGKLLLFKGTSESNAKFLMAKDIIDPTNGWNNDPSAYVTTTKVAVAKIDKLTLTATEQLFAYVVLNYGGTELATNPAINTPFSTWSEKVLEAANRGGSLEGEISSNGLLMTNAPIAYKQGGSVNPTGATILTAVQLDKEKVKNTKAEAEAAPAGCIYVERATAKVTMSVNVSNTTIGMKDASETNLAMDPTTIAWQIINTEPNFYNTRQANVPAWLPYFNPGCTNANAKYRFVSNDLFSPQLPSAVAEDHTQAYRTYFAKDLQFDKLATLDKDVAIDDAEHWLGAYAEEKGKRAYVPENTFNTEFQTRHNTTQATIRVKFNGGSDFYTISNDALYYTAANAKNKIASEIRADFDVDKYLKQANQDIANTASSESTALLTVNFTTSDAGKVTYTVTPAFTTTSASYTAEDITDATIKTNLLGAIENAIARYTVTLYKNGYSYYNVRIKHFGEVETPWSSAGAYITQPGETTEQIYKISDSTYGDNYFLGRYGIVRDNWYKLEIDEIAKLGSAVPPSVKNDPTPDDEIEDEYYISCHVHVLPWVLRTQSVKF